MPGGFRADFIMLTLLASLLLFPGENAESVADLLEKAKPGNAKEVRIDALQKLQYSKPKDPAAVCKLLEQFVDDEDIQIRDSVFFALAVVGTKGELECPLVLIEAINNEDNHVSKIAGDMAKLFNKIPEAALTEIAKAAQSQNWRRRCDAASLLHGKSQKTSESIKILTPLLTDSNEFVRYEAQLSHFKATRDFSVFVTYLLRYTSRLNQSIPAKTEQEKKEKKWRAFQKWSVATFFYRFAFHRPKDLAKELVEKLQEKDARVRQSALRQLRAMCVSSQESFQAIPKAKALKSVEQLFDDKNENVSTWARLVHSILLDGPPKGTPEKMKPLESVVPREKITPIPTD